jgi:diaminopimelate dehydrogenase
MTIKIGIAGYGNLGKGVECAIRHNPDLELSAIFTRRDLASITPLFPGVKVYSMEEAISKKDSTAF